MEERWLPVPGWPGYEVSNLGQVRSLPRFVRRQRGNLHRVHGRTLSQSVQKGDVPYRIVNMHGASGRRAARRVHAVVLEAFVGPRPPGLLVRHLNGDPADNSLANLKYGTATENNRDTSRHGKATNQNAGKESCRNGHQFNAANTYVYPDGRRECRSCRPSRPRRRQRPV